MIRSAFILCAIISLLTSCNSDQEEQTSTHGLKITYSQGVWMNPDSFAKPITIPAGEPTVIPAGEPTVIPTNLNVHIAGEPTVIPVGTPRVCTPGTDTFSTPKTVPAKGKVVPAGIPEVVIAKDAASKDVNPANFCFYKTLQGLKNNNVRGMLQDKTGNLWFGTYGWGVSRYDGKSFTNFTEKEGLSNNFVWSILEDKTGNLWFGTKGGVCRYDGKTFTNFTEKEGLSNNVVNAILEDKTGNLWFGTDGGGVCRYNGKTFTNFTEKQGLSNNVVWSILEDKTGNLWFGTDSGACRYDGKSFTNFTEKEGLSNNVVASILEDKTGNLWFSTYGGGVCRYDGESFANFTQKEGLSNNFVSAIVEDKIGNLWFGTYGGGICRYDGNRVEAIERGEKIPLSDQQDLKREDGKLVKSFTNFTDNEGLGNNLVQSILEDKTGNLWFGTAGSGVSRYDGKSFTNITENEGLGNNLVVSMLEDKTGNLWFGTYGGGVCRYDGKSFTNFTDKEGLTNNFVLSILQDKTGNLWFGTNGGGVCRYDGKSFTNFTDKEGLTDNFVSSILEDKTGNLWFGTYGGGVCRYDGKSFTKFTEKEGLSNNTVWSILEDKTGNFWFGTQGGVSRYDGKSFTNFTEEEGLSNNFVYCGLEDKTVPTGEVGIWFGTNGGGVCRYDGKSFTNFTEKEGLSNNAVLNMVQDVDGNIWFGTRKGLSKVGRVQLIRLAEKNENYNPIKEALFYNYGYNDGFLGLNCRRNSVLQDSKGRIWWGTDFLTCYDPQGDQADLIAPSVNVSSLKLYGENIAWTSLGALTMDSTGNETISGVSKDSILSNGILLSGIEFDSISPWYNLPQHLSLPYDNSNITFNYIGVHMQSRNHIKYQYKLENLDEFWSSITERTEAPYGNVPPGEYVFKVKAMNQSGVWSEPFEYAFEVRPPWWETTWFRSGTVLFIIASVVGFFRFRTRQLRVRQKELEQTVEERTAEVVEQKHLVEEKQKDIIDSINYAQRIQRALLASDNVLRTHLPEHFVFFRPKDIVSGDFYWASLLSNNQFALVTADSTGHGVPGAIMSMLNISCLEKAVDFEHQTSPAHILNFTRSRIINTLSKDGSTDGGKDGMDCSLISFDFANKRLTFAGANNPVWIVRNKEMIELLADKMPVGKHDKDNVPFTEQEFQLQKGDCVYALTDGMPDQFGGPKGKKFKYKPLKELLVSISHESMDDQKKIILETFENWRGDLEQVDDVTIVGVRI